MNNTKSVTSVFSTAARHWVGDGFPVQTVFSAHAQDPSAISPFLLLDYAGPKSFEPSVKPRGVDEHPHRGFETVTIVYQGELEHRDSNGNSGKIGPGDVQWMTAASGVVHEEKHGTAFTKRGGMFEVVQLWVNLPAREKMTSPRYQEIVRDSIPTAQLADGAGTLRVIAGQFAGHNGPARTVTPINLWDLRLIAGKCANFTLSAGYNTLVFVMHGEVTINNSRTIKMHECAALSQDGESFSIEASKDAVLLILNGEPIDEPVVAHGPFVMNSTVEIKQAFQDYQAGRMGHLEPVIS